MRTTIDLPDDLFRRAKATAALRGVKLKELFTSIIERGLMTAPEVGERFGRNYPFPVVIDAPNVEVPLMTNDEAVFGTLDCIRRRDD
jgi:hypothetical protein